MLWNEKGAVCVASHIQQKFSLPTCRNRKHWDSHYQSPRTWTRAALCGNAPRTLVLLSYAVHSLPSCRLPVTTPIFNASIDQLKTRNNSLNVQKPEETPRVVQNGQKSIGPNRKRIRVVSRAAHVDPEVGQHVALTDRKIHNSKTAHTSGCVLRIRSRSEPPC